MRFNVTLDQEEDGIWIVECPAMPGCVSQGKTRDEALDNIKEAIALCLEVRTDKGPLLTIETQQIEVEVLGAMTTQWPSDDEIGDDIFETLHSGLVVALIATERKRLMTCRLNESLSVVVPRSTERQYDHLPVTNDDGGDIIGLLHTRECVQYASGTERVGGHFQPLSEGDLIGANASILDFIKEADSRPCRLIVSESEIIGLVTLSDLQRLPVRVALFALITGLERTMAGAIRKKYTADEDWLRLLGQCRQEKINGEVGKSKKQYGYVNRLLFTQFCDKRDILLHFFPSSLSKTKLRRQLEGIEKLRNQVAHASDYAATQTDAQNVCAVVRSLLKLRGEIVHFVTRRSA